MARNEKRGEVRVNPEGVRAEAIETNPVVLPSSGDAERAASAARSFGRLSELFSSIGDHAAQREGQRAGRTDAMDGTFTPMRAMTIRAEAYDAAGLEIDLRQRQVTMRQDLEALFEAHSGDPLALRAALKKKRDDVLAGSFEETAPDLMLSFEQVSHAYLKRADELHRNRFIADQTAAFAGDVDARAQSLENQARITGYDATSSIELGREIADFERALEGARLDGVPYLTPDKKQAVLSNVVKRVAIARAEGTYERMETVQQKEQFVAGLKESGAFDGLDEKGRQAAIEVFQNRFLNELQAEVTQGLQFASDEEMEARLDLAFPEKGDPLYDEKGKIYANASRAVAAIRRERVEDPAGSVARHPAVAEARAARTVEDPDSFVRYVEALVAAQQDVGVASPRHLPRREAAQLLQGVVQAAPEQKMDELQTLADYVDRTYGEFSDGVFKDILMTAGHGDQITEAAMPILKSMQSGLGPSAGDVEVLTSAIDAKSASSAYGDAGITYRDENGAEEWVPMAGPANEVRPFSKGMPPMEARAELIQNPDLAEEFDDEYGEGSAASVLGGKKKPLVVDTGALSQSLYPGLERVPHPINPRADFDRKFGAPSFLGGPSASPDLAAYEKQAQIVREPSEVFDAADDDDFIDAFNSVGFFIDQGEEKNAASVLDAAMESLEDLPGAIEVLGAIERHPRYSPDMPPEQFRDLLVDIVEEGGERSLMQMDDGRNLQDVIREDIDALGFLEPSKSGKQTAFFIGRNAATASDVPNGDWKTIGDAGEWHEIGAKGYRLNKVALGISYNTLEQTLKMEPLYQAYPSLRDVELVYDESVPVEPIPGSGKRLAFRIGINDRGKRSIYINPDIVDKSQSIRFNIIAAAQMLVMVSEYEASNPSAIKRFFDGIAGEGGPLGRDKWKAVFLEQAFERRGMGKRKRKKTPFDRVLQEKFEQHQFRRQRTDQGEE